MLILSEPTMSGGVMGNRLSPQDTERRVLYSFYTFKEGSPLRDYILLKTNTLRDGYMLLELLNILKRIIKNETMYDIRNTTIALFDKDLEKALNVRALHVSELREVVISQIVRLPWADQFRLINEALISCRLRLRSSNIASDLTSDFSTPSAVPAGSPTTSGRVEPSVYRSPTSQFLLKPDFRRVVSHLSTFKADQTLFTYSEATTLLSQYILSKKATFFDSRNITVAMIKGDPLSNALNVDAFHRSQVHTLLKTQLVYVSNIAPPRRIQIHHASEIIINGPGGQLFRYTLNPGPADPRLPSTSGSASATSTSGVDQLLNIPTDDSATLKRSGSPDPMGDVKKPRMAENSCQTESSLSSGVATSAVGGSLTTIIGLSNRPQRDELCMVCCASPTDASFIHGRWGHQVCCYECSIKIWKTPGTCPVCRRKIEKVVRNILL